MGFLCGAVHDNDGVRFYGDAEALLQLLLAADCIVTYNGEYFDFPLLIAAYLETQEVYNENTGFSLEFREIYETLITKSLDLSIYIQKALGHTLPFNSIRKVLCSEKNMCGTEFAGKFLSENPFERLDAINYLIGDVLDLYKVHGCGVYNGKLAYIDQATGEKIGFNIQFPPMLT